jgi:glycosyltransferase involved in cell wall biosynthesis
LVVAYDFPPHAAIGTMRTLRLVRQLSENGWDVTVVSSSPRTYLDGTPTDPKLERQVPSSVRVIRASALRPFDWLTRALKRAPSGSRSSSPLSSSDSPALNKSVRSGPVRSFKDWLDAVLSIPDKESGWILPATVRGIVAMLRQRPGVLYSSAPPWSGQVVALLLKLVFRSPWVADFRDPWARAPARDWGKPFRQRAAAVLERLVVRHADAVVFVTPANMAEFTSLYGPSAARKFHVVPNGCDPSEFRGLAPAAPDPERFVLLHAGSIYAVRNPLPIVRAIAGLVEKGLIGRNGFRLRFLGWVPADGGLRDECRRLGIEDVVEFVPRVTRTESLVEMLSASALLLIQTGTTMSIPGKAYEYIAAGRPILALTQEGDTAALVRASGNGVVVGADDPQESIESGILEVIRRSGEAPVPPAADLFDSRVHMGTIEQLLAAMSDGEHGVTAGLRHVIDSKDTNR